MFSKPEKVVVRVPFNMLPKPIWYPSRRRAFKQVGRKVAYYDLEPSWWKLAGIVFAAMRN
jgi:hypothetical protein